jgi:hypothetical protein
MPAAAVSSAVPPKPEAMKAFFLYLGQLLLRASLDAAVKRALPEIYRRLDMELPAMLSHQVSAPKVKSVIAGAIGDAIGHRATTTQVQTIAALYDPIAAAANALRAR